MEGRYLGTLRKITTAEVNVQMPFNKSTKIDDKQNKSRLKSEAVTLNSRKASEYPPNLNEINKNES